MIKRLYVDNYKCLVNFDLKLDELSLILGPNGVGKSSVLDEVYAIRQLLGGVAKVTDAGIFPTSTLTRWQSRDTQAIEFDVSVSGDELTYRLEVEHDRPNKRARITREVLTEKENPLFSFEMGTVQLYRDDHSEGPRYSADWSESALARVPAYGEQNRRLTAFLEHTRKIIVCGLYPAGFVPESSRRDPILLRDVSNFVSWYHHLVLERQDLVPDFTAQLQEVIHGFRAINLPSVGQETVAMKVMFQEGEQRYDLRIEEISDGQRALIAIYALVLLTSEQGYSLFLDEPDNYLALREIQPWLFCLEDACGETLPQAVLCSHHPELIDYLGGDRGILLERESSGVIKPGRIEEADLDEGLKLSELVARGWER